MMIAFDGGTERDERSSLSCHRTVAQGLACHLIAVSTGGSTLRTEMQAAREQLTGAGYNVSAENKPEKPKG